MHNVAVFYTSNAYLASMMLYNLMLTISDSDFDFCITYFCVRNKISMLFFTISNLHKIQERIIHHCI